MSFGDYYDPSSKTVVDGDTILADDINAINLAIDAAFESVANDLDTLNGPGVLPIQNLVPSAGTFPYYTSSNTAAVTSITAQGRAILDDATASDQKTTIGLGNVPNVDCTNATNITSGTLAEARIDSQITRDSEVNTATTAALALKANIDSPTFTGTPSAPTPSADDNTTKVATTAYVLAQLSSSSPIMDGSVASGSSLKISRADHVHPSDTSKTSVSDLSNSSVVAKGAGLVGYKGRTLYDRMSEVASVKDFGATGDGLTNDTTAIQNAVNYAMSNKVPLFVPTGTYLVTSITIGSNLRMVGAGPAASIFKQSSAGASVFYYNSASSIANIYIDSLGFNINSKDSGIYITNVSSLTIKNCDFSNNPYWGIHVGIESGSEASTTITCEDILIENCRFNNSTSTYEHILLFNSRNAVVRDCQFVGALSGGIGVGLYQNLRHITISGCFFKDISKGIYYSISTDDISVTDCRFQGCAVGVKGANESDNGLFGLDYVYGLSIDTCYFYENTWALEVGAVKGGSISNCRFERNVENCIVFSYGNGLTTPKINPSINIEVSNCNFLNNNTAGTFHVLHPAVLFNEGGGTTYVTFFGCTFEDSQVTNTQYYPVTFNGAYTWSVIRFFGCRLSSYSTGKSIALNNSAVLSDVKLYGCTSLSTLPSGVTEVN